MLAGSCQKFLRRFGNNPHTLNNVKLAPQSLCFEMYRGVNTRSSESSKAHSPDTSSKSSKSGVSQPKTAVVMLNMGGPSKPEDTGDFLTRLFSDQMIINLGKFQFLAPYISKLRTRKVQLQYEAIGGSPIRKWTEIQGQAMCKRLDEISPETAPHKPYVMFRYASPLTEETLDEMVKDGVTRSVAFSQYPMYSCTTTGSSLTYLWQCLKDRKLEDRFKWSVIDRWNDHPTYIAALAQRVRMALDKVENPKSTLIVFSAHSLPQMVVARGDQYQQEVAHTVQLVMKELNYPSPYILSWQSKVGFLPWLEPSTAATIESIAPQNNYKSILLVPIAFTSDHIETLYEIDVEYKELAHKSGIPNFTRAPALNDEPLLIEAQAQLVASHLRSGEKWHSKQYEIRCQGCQNDNCRTVVNAVSEPTN